MSIEKKNKDEQLLFESIKQLIQNSCQKAAVYLNQATNHLYWSIGNYIVKELDHEVYSGYGKQIIATLSQQLTNTFGKGYSYSALTRMIKIADNYPQEMFATLSQTLSWSHFIELVTIEDQTKRFFYQQMCVLENWSVRTLRSKQDEMLFERTAIAKQPKQVIVSSLEDCSEGNTEHIELLLLGDENIKVAQYLTKLPDKQWFADKLHKAMALVQEQGLTYRKTNDEH